MADIVYEATADELDGSTVTNLHYFSERDTLYTIQVTNSLDVSVTVDAYRTHRTDMGLTDAVPSVSKTASADSNTSLTLVVDAWEAYGLEISFSGDPSSGELTIREHTR